MWFWGGGIEAKGSHFSPWNIKHLRILNPSIIERFLKKIHVNLSTSPTKRITFFKTKMMNRESPYAWFGVRLRRLPSIPFSNLTACITEGVFGGNKDGFQQMIEVDMYAVVKKTPSPTVMVPPGHPRGRGREGYVLG
jgi:hypothetical protein